MDVVLKIWQPVICTWAQTERQVNHKSDLSLGLEIRPEFRRDHLLVMMVGLFRCTWKRDTIFEIQKNHMFLTFNPDLSDPFFFNGSLLFIEWVSLINLIKVFYNLVSTTFSYFSLLIISFSPNFCTSWLCIESTIP